jgi:TonB family protein
MEPLSFQTSSVLSWLFESTIYIALLTCMILAIKAFSRKKLPAWWHYGLWLLLLFRMLIPWGIDSRLSIFNYIPAPIANNSFMPYLKAQELNISFKQDEAGTAVFPDAQQIKESAQNRVSGNDVNSSRFHMSLDKALLILWIIGAMVFGGILLVKNLQFWRIVRRGPPATDKKILEQLEECKALMSVRKDVPVILTDRVKSPAIFGYFKPRLLLPPSIFETLETTELHCIFLHELGHLKRHDTGISWLVTVLQVIHWFNPFVWLAFHNLRIDQEAACDAYILSKIKKVTPADYAHTIISLLERFCQNRSLPSLAGIIENKAQIRRRILMIVNYKKYTRKMTFATVFMLTIVGFFFFTVSKGLSTAPEERGARFIQLENSDMKRYENHDWNFAVSIPNGWNYLPLDPASNRYEVVRFGSNKDGTNTFSVSRYILKPGQSLLEILKQIQPGWAQSGFGNFVTAEKAMGHRKAVVQDFSMPRGDGTWSVRQYYVAEGPVLHVLQFGTTDKNIKFELYDRIAESFEIHTESTTAGLKRFESFDGTFVLDIPGSWNPIPADSVNGVPDEVIRFISVENGDHFLAIARKSSYPGQSLDAYRDQMQRWLTDKGGKNFAASETLIGSQRVLLLDVDFPASSPVLHCRGYFLEGGKYLYMLGFGSINTDGMIELYDRMVKSLEFTAESTSAGKNIGDSSGTPNRTDGDIMESKLIKKVLPTYPDEAKPKGLTGTVILLLTVNEEGRVSDAKVLQGHPLFSEAAISAVKQWVYSPTMINGKPVSAIATVVIHFNMPGSYFVHMDKSGHLQDPRSSMNSDTLMEQLLQTEATIRIAIPSETPFQVAETTLKDLAGKGAKNIQIVGPYDLHQNQLFYITREAFTPAALDAVSPAVLALDANRLHALAVASSEVSGAEEKSSRLIYFVYINEAGKIFGLNRVLGPKIAAVEEELLRTRVIASGQRGANPVPVRMVVEIQL